MNQQCIIFHHTFNYLISLIIFCCENNILNIYV